MSATIASFKSQLWSSGDATIAQLFNCFHKEAVANGFIFSRPAGTANVLTVNSAQTGTTITATTGTILSTAPLNRIYRVTLTSGALPTGLVNGDYYHVTRVTDTTFRMRAGGPTYTSSTDISLVSATGAFTLTEIGIHYDPTEGRSPAYNASVGSNGNMYLSGFRFNATTDLSTGYFYDRIATSTSGTLETRTGIFYGFIDVNDNFCFYTLTTSATLFTGRVTEVLIELGTQTPTYTCSNGFDKTQVVSGFWIYPSGGTGAGENSDNGFPYKINPIPKAFGASMTMNEIIAYMVSQTASTFKIVREAVPNTDVYFLGLPIRIGDGTNVTSFALTNGTIIFPPISENSIAFDENYYNIAPLSFGAVMTASDTFELKNAQIKNPQSYSLIFSGTPVTYNTDGCTIIGATIENDGPNISTVVFVDCVLNITSKQLLTCTLDSCNAVDIDLVEGNTIKNASVGVFVDSGNTSPFLSIAQKTFINNTVDIEVRDTSGTVTIELGDKAEPTYTTAGATVLFVQNVLITAPNIIDDTRVLLYNITKDLVLNNSVVSGGLGYSYTANLNGADISDGDIIRLLARYQNGTTAKQLLDTSGQVSSSGLTFIDSQVDCPIYIGWAIDGSLITKFTADYIDNEVDIVVSSNFTLSELGAWWVYNETTAQGIEYFAGGITFDDSANLRIHNLIVDINLDNTTTSNVHQTDNRRLYREDGARPVKEPTTGGGGIDVEWRSPVSLADIDEFMSKIDGVKAKTDQLNFTGTDVQSIASNMRGTDNALLASNYTAPDNATIGKIKKESGLIPALL